MQRPYGRGYSSTGIDGQADRLVKGLKNQKLLQILRYTTIKH